MILQIIQNFTNSVKAKFMKYHALKNFESRINLPIFEIVWVEAFWTAEGWIKWIIWTYSYVGRLYKFIGSSTSEIFNCITVIYTVKIK